MLRRVRSETRDASSSLRRVTLGQGECVPYPEPTSDTATKVGKGNRRANTKPEVRLRSILHRRGLRFRKDHLVRLDGLTVRPDVVFTRARVAVFVDGCFWHGCPEHQRVPKSNRDYWVPKLRSNVERDRRVSAALSESGWRVERFWEHEDLEHAARRVEQVVELSRRRLGQPTKRS